MTPARFLEVRAPAWDRLEALLRRAGRKGASALSEEELHELTRLYPAVAVDVARARMYGLDGVTQRRVNQVAIAAHGLLYRRPNSRPIRAIWRFFARDYPRLFRRLWVYMAMAVSIFAVGTLGTYACVRLRPATAYLFVPQGLDVSDSSAVTAEDVSERYRRMPKPPMASTITANNISVAFFAFALGILAAVGTAYLLLVNAMILGAFFAHFANHALSYECWSFLVPHGALEIFAILCSAAAGLRLGLSWVTPGPLTRRASLKAGAREAVLLVLGTIPMFLVAGVAESYLTPSYLPGGAKIAAGLLLLGTFLAYLLRAGRTRPGATGGAAT